MLSEARLKYSGSGYSKGFQVPIILRNIPPDLSILFVGSPELKMSFSIREDGTINKKGITFEIYKLSKIRKITSGRNMN